MKTITIIASIIIFTSLVSAGFGVSFPTTIPLQPGEIYEGNINLQNVIIPTEDTTFEIIVEEGQEFIEFPNGNQVFVKSGEVVNIPVIITAPEKSRQGSLKVLLLFQPISETSGQQGTVNVVFALKKSFELEILQDKNAQTIAVIALILLVIIASIKKK
jgi:hypothetical protein